MRTATPALPTVLRKFSKSKRGKMKKQRAKKMNSKNIWRVIRENEFFDVSKDVANRHIFLSCIDGEAITIEHELLLPSNKMLLDVATHISLCLNAPVTGDEKNEYSICGELRGYPVLVLVECLGKYDYNEGSSVIANNTTQIKVSLTGHRDVIYEVINNLEQRFTQTPTAKVRWWYKADRGTDKVLMFLDNLKTTLHSEFYPGMGSSPYDYLKQYLDAEESVLLIAGVPGSGKSTLLRHLIVDFNLQADIVYDETLMSKDLIFQDFLFGKSQLLVIEDADNILTSRKNNNTLMSRFLNVSDGLVKLPDKKLIFTTNIDDFGRIDPALVRPGRCFDLLHTRELAYEEAIAACRVANLPIPIEHKPYTIAELFTKRQVKTIRKVGF